MMAVYSRCGLLRNSAKANCLCIGLRQGSPLGAMGILVGGLLCKSAARGQFRHVRLEVLVCADDICLMASCSEHLQALVNALAAYSATLHMDTKAAAMKKMEVSKLDNRLETASVGSNPIS